MLDENRRFVEEIPPVAYQREREIGLFGRVSVAIVKAAHRLECSSANRDRAAQEVCATRRCREIVRRAPEGEFRRDRRPVHANEMQREGGQCVPLLERFAYLRCRFGGRERGVVVQEHKDIAGSHTGDAVPAGRDAQIDLGADPGRIRMRQQRGFGSHVTHDHLVESGRRCKRDLEFVWAVVTENAERQRELTPHRTPSSFRSSR